MLHNGKVLANDPSLGISAQKTKQVPVLKFRDNSLNFSFAAAFYEQPESNRYSWFLDGFDKEWTPWSRENKAVYTNLSEGTYCFKVKARNIYHQESDTAVFQFTVSPPWFRTTLAYILYGIGLLLLTAGAYIGHKVKVAQAILQERKKYEKCFLDPGLADVYTRQLLQFMETRKPYLDPNLSLASLAKAVGIQHHYISQVLNINLEKNFWDFIKEYRIAEARKILADPAQDHLSILEVAINVGFNSSSTFNLAFKKITGMTPSAYRVSRAVEKE
jgi:AraC-like DNA-binding protein